jgi:hypothetical protein
MRGSEGAFANPTVGEHNPPLIQLGTNNVLLTYSERRIEDLALRSSTLFISVLSSVHDGDRNHVLPDQEVSALTKELASRVIVFCKKCKYDLGKV